MKWLGVITALVAAGAAYGVNWCVGGYHLLGVPVGESEVTEATSGGVSASIDMTDGYPFKMNPANLAVGTIIYIVPAWVVIEGGFEMHTGYKNKEATIKTTMTQWLEDEDNVTWKMNNFYVGYRYDYQISQPVWIFARLGAIYSLSKLEYADEFHGNPITGDLSATGNHPGLYVGGGWNWWVIPKLAITGMYTYNILFEGTYTYDGLPGTYEEKWKPARYLTAATGVEYCFGSF
jgi:hypothetical protein